MAADEEGKAAMFAEVKAEVEAEDRARDEAEEKLASSRPEWMKNKQAFLKKNKFNMLMHLPKVPEQKFLGVPDQQRSRAWPLPSGSAGPVVVVPAAAPSAATRKMPSLPKPGKEFIEKHKSKSSKELI